jgi:hypothetical protein
MGNLSDTYTQSGRTEEALALVEEVLERAQRTLGPDHPHTLYYANILVIHLLRVGREVDALRVADEALKAAAGREGNPAVARSTLRLRLRVCDLRRDAAGMRQALAKWAEFAKPTGAYDLYNMACFTARLSALVRATDTTPAGAAQADADADRAMEWLRKAVAAGYRNLANMDKDTDLDALRGRADFQEMIASLRPKEPAAAPTPPK